MKKPLYSLLLLLCLVACHKDDKEKVEIFLPGPKLFGSGLALKVVPGVGKENWEASGGAVRDKPDFFDVRFATRNNDSEQREDLSISEIPLASGRYAIQTGGPANPDDGIIGASYHRLLADGDVVGASYYAMDHDNPANFVEVTVDTVAKTAKGTFSVAFKLLSQDLGQDFPETVIFKDGTFDVRFIKW